MNDAVTQWKPTIDEQRDFYDERWSRKGYANRLQLERTREILHGLSYVMASEPPRILELGCGTGWLTGILGRFGPATGIELSAEAVARARGVFADVDFRAMDISSSNDFENFDVVVSHEVIEHLDDQTGHITLARRCLRPGGILILTTPNGRRCFRPHLNRGGSQPIENWLTLAKLRSMLSQDFDVVESRTIVRPSTGMGIISVLNAAKVRALFSALRLLPTYDGLLKRLGFGRHLYVVARAR